jgi:hypothetical protein
LPGRGVEYVGHEVFLSARRRRVRAPRNCARGRRDQPDLCADYPHGAWH